ncbi:MAG: hypothetical protein OEZ06_13120 [Myxococcales bacterium]|nr:hypothetical protein [Myxococcales bacterium]
MSLCVSAPGKMMIAGEYAVLHGAEALVAAVSRRARLTLDAEREVQAELPPEVQAARALAEARLGPVAGTLSLDVSELRAGDSKLGLGSSSAAAAAAAGIVHAAHGRDLQAPEVRAQVLHDALAGHRSIAPEGSGADVAAAVLGGFVRFVRGSSPGADPETRLLTWPQAVALKVVWTGKAVRTSDMLAQVAELRARDAASHDRCMEAIADEAARLLSALGANDTSGVVSGFERHAEAMAALGRAAGIPIVDDTTQAVRELARRHGGAAKPSGAGGGDVVLAVFDDPGRAESFEGGCTAAQFSVLSITVGDVGERVEVL